MRKIVYTLLLSLIMIGGLFIGMVKGQEVRNKWISKMKFKHEERKENKKPVPPAVFVDHKLLTPITVDHFYPNDGLLQNSAAFDRVAASA